MTATSLDPARSRRTRSLLGTRGQYPCLWPLALVCRKVSEQDRWLWELYQLRRSPLEQVSPNDIALDALPYGDSRTWTAGGGTRANQKLQGLSWLELLAYCEAYDLRFETSDPLLVRITTRDVRPPCSGYRQSAPFPWRRHHCMAAGAPRNRSC